MAAGVLLPGSLGSGMELLQLLDQAFVEPEFATPAAFLSNFRPLNFDRSMP